MVNLVTRYGIVREYILFRHNNFIYLKKNR